MRHKAFLSVVFFGTCFFMVTNLLFQRNHTRLDSESTHAVSLDFNTSLKVVDGLGGRNDLSSGQYKSQNGLKQKLQPNETDDEFMRRIEGRMKQRRATIANACHSSNLLDADLTKLRLIPAKKYNLLYCFIPKTGCTHMKFLVMALNGIYNLTYTTVHFAAKRIMYTGNAIPNLSRRKNFIKVILVRHPYERLVSAFLNKIDSKQEKVFYAKSRAIRKHYGNASRSMEKRKTANFEEFTDYLTDEKRPPLKGGVESHWNTYYSLCQPCAFEYDVIIHLETVDEDLRYLLKLIKAPPELKYKGGYSGKGESRTSRLDLVNKYFKNLSPTKKKKLFKIYKTDFDLFNYDRGLW